MAQQPIDPKDIAKALSEMQEMKSAADKVKKEFNDITDITRELTKELIKSDSLIKRLRESVRSMKAFSAEALHGVKSLKNASTLLAYMQGMTDELVKHEGLVTTFTQKSIYARSVIRELQDAENNGLKITKKRRKEIEAALIDYGNTQKSIASDEKVNQSFINDLVTEYNHRAEESVNLKRRMVEVDSGYLANRRLELDAGNRTLAQLEAKAAHNAEQLETEERRKSILEQRVMAEKVIADIQSKLSSGNLTKKEKTELNKLLKEQKAGLLSLGEAYEATGSKFTKDAKAQLRAVERTRKEFYQKVLADGIILAEERQKQAGKDIVHQKSLGGYLQHINRTEDARLGILGQQYASIKSFFDVSKMIPKPFMLLDFLISSAVDRFMALDKAAESFRKNTGFTINQMAEVRKNAERINLDFADMGVSIEQAYKSAEVLTNVFGRTSMLTKEAMLNVSLLSQNLGVSEENSAQVLETFMGIGQASEKAAFDTIKLGTALSDKAGVPFAMVMKDIANASDTAINMIGSAPKKLMKAAIAARALGLDINKVAESQRKLLDFSSSITDELSASALLGKSISFQKARQLAFEGKSAEATKEILKTVKKAGDFDKMNVYQREAIAKATGMSLKDLSKALAVDKQRESILQGSDEAAKSKLLAQEAELERLDKLNEEEEKNILLQNDKALKQRQMQGAMTKLKNIMDSLIIAFADILEPIITALTDVIIPAFKGVVGILKLTVIPLLNLMAFPISVVAKLLGKIGSLIEGVATRFEPVRTIIESVRKALDSTFGDVLKFVVGGGLLYLFFLKGFSMSGLMEMISRPFTALKDMATGAIKNIKSKLTGAAPKVTELTSPESKPKIDASAAAETASGASDKSKNIKSGTNVKDFFKNLAQGLKYMASTKVLLGALNLIPASIGLTAMIPGAIGAKLISLVDGKKFGTALESIARGMEKMAGAKVSGGIKNMVLASIGLTAMIPGAIGAKLISIVDGKKFQEAMEAISNGIQKMAGAKISGGIKNLLLASVGLTAMIPGAVGARIIQTVDGKRFSEALKAISSGIAQMGGSKILSGAKNMVIAAVGLTAMIPGAVGARIIQTVDGERFSQGMRAISDGIERMASVKVLRGAFNMVIASAGLTAMIPGAAGARIIQTVDSKRFSQGMRAISDGIERMASVKVLRGAFNMVIASVGLTAMIPGAVGAKIIQTIDSKRFIQAMEAISSGISQMASAKVFGGALNMVIASAGLIAMIPGAIGARLVQTINKKKFIEGMEAISSGISTMANTKVLRGALSAAIVSVALTAMIPGAVGARLVQTISKKKFIEGMEGIASGISKMANTKVLRGALSAAIVAVALTAMIPGAIAAAILGAIGKPIEMGLKFLASGIGYMGNPKVFLGALGIAAVGLAILPFAYAMKMFGDVDWGAVGLGSLALIGFTAAAFGLGAILMSGVGAAIFGAGVIGIAALGAALIPFGVAALAAGAGVKMLGEGISSSVDPILRLSEIDLTQAALGIGAVGLALAAFGAGSAYAGLGSFVGNLLGGDPIAKMERLGKAGASLMITANAINTISESFQKFEAVSQFAESINVLTESLSGLNAELEKTSTIKLAALAAMTAVGGRKESKETTDQSGGGESSAIVEKLDSIYQALVGGEVAVYMDSVKVSKKIAETA